ncbi:19600_t:CDS:2 [Gigaspora margarita]|uniref:19600_t:CDS:1 n=1 Tax=Gigaspora margarita TaxID=4874 RepID=A0ABM8VXY4_GIGMA|nr:19600_t:CDS:2 [Gigaspora margarita]
MRRTQIGREKEKKKDKNTSPISLIGTSKEKIREKTGYLDNAVQANT